MGSKECCRRTLSVGRFLAKLLVLASPPCTVGMQGRQPTRYKRGVLFINSIRWNIKIKACSGPKYDADIYCE